MITNSFYALLRFSRQGLGVVAVELGELGVDHAVSAAQCPARIQVECAGCRNLLKGLGEEKSTRTQPSADKKERKK